MVLAIPGGRGLFSVLQEVLKKQCDNGTRVRLTPIVHSVLQDFRWLATDMVWRPTRIAELIPSRLPATLGTQYASGIGMGGVHFVPLPNGRVQPLLWRSKFDEHVQSQLVTFDNTGGTVSTSDLELAASVAQHDVLAQQVDVREATIHNLTDNTATMYWQRRGRLPPLDQHPECYAPSPCTSGIIVMYHLSTTSQGRRTPCRMTAAGVGT
jgi:hypothetical protein